jgi:hypothetical protein
MLVLLYAVGSVLGMGHVAGVGGVIGCPNFGFGLAVRGHRPQVIARILRVGSRQYPVCEGGCAFDYIAPGGVFKNF